MLLAQGELRGDRGAIDATQAGQHESEPPPLFERERQRCGGGTRARRPAGRIDLEIAMGASPWDVTWLGARRDSHPGGHRLDH